MAYDEQLADRLRSLLDGEPAVEKRMFGGLAFLVQGNMAVAASGRGGLLVRVPPEATEALLGEPGAEEFEMQGRPTRGWLWVRGDVLDDDDVLATWVDRGVAFAGSLPAK